MWRKYHPASHCTNIKEDKYDDDKITKNNEKIAIVKKLARDVKKTTKHSPRSTLS